MHELFEDAATTLVTELSDFVIEHLGVAHRILTDHAREQVLAEGIELGADLPRLARRCCSFAQQPADGLAVAPCRTRNFTNRFPADPCVVNVHELPLADHLGPSWCDVYCDRSNLPQPGWVGNFKPALSGEFHTGADTGCSTDQIRHPDLSTIHRSAERAGGARDPRTPDPRPPSFPSGYRVEIPIASGQYPITR